MLEHRAVELRQDGRSRAGPSLMATSRAYRGVSLKSSRRARSERSTLSTYS